MSSPILCEDFSYRNMNSFIAGGGMGIFMGMLFGALETPVHAETMTAKQNFLHAARTMSTKSVQMAKTFSVMGAIFAGTECVFEKVTCYTSFYSILTDYPLSSSSYCLLSIAGSVNVSFVFVLVNSSSICAFLSLDSDFLCR